MARVGVGGRAGRRQGMMVPRRATAARGGPTCRQVPAGVPGEGRNTMGRAHR
ncbi:hypothetical protein KCH_32490 [Kitasatospora cheerisanensis KCTC 2395]|uniref:Uncharacterized protein n=1 Tax=Kitasatospora cheerisanensis KCTC 2395 TaxID=1348663 RepID=A0A066Z4R8_9ACTN|nr:hypothetical protein KCH_32490 [Kitasatospora cheerisanensis KCTC 2395]